MHHPTPPSRCELCVPTITRTEHTHTLTHETACPDHPRNLEDL